MIALPHLRRCSLLCALLLSLLLPRASAGQISLATAVDLALRSSPRVLLAQSDVVHARAVLEETRDIYIPSLSGGSGLGYSYGFPLGQPTLFNFTAQSLVFSFAQKDYIRAARAGLDSANFALIEARQAVAEDTAITFLELDHDAGRETALRQQRGYVERLVTIVQDRVDAGEDTPIGVTSARLAAAQIRLALLRTEDDTAVDRAHMSHLTGLPVEGLEVAHEDFPAVPMPPDESSSLGASTSPGIDAAYANARARREQAFGDARYLWRPQVVLAAQYSRFSTFNNYQEYYGRRDAAGNQLSFQYNAAAFGVQITIPILDYVHKARARESAAEAVRAEHDADQQRDTFTEGRIRTQRSVAELVARAEITELDQQLAEQQLAVIRLQLQSKDGAATPLTPKDEQNALITERDKYLTLLDARFQMQQAQLNLLRQTGSLESWLKGLGIQPVSSSTNTLRVQP